MAIVYKHTRKTTGEPFYIGIGASIKRAYSKVDRNRYWRSIVEKDGYDVWILHTDLTWQEACSREVELIAEIGRRDLGLGPLINLTDGGEGTVGAVRLQERTIRIIETKRKKGTLMHTQETKRKISQALKGKVKSETHRRNSSLARIGKPQTEESKKKKSEAMKGMVRPRVECPNCGRVGAVNGMKRYHFENCKVKVV